MAAAFEAGGTTDQVMQRLMAQTQAGPNMQNEANSTGATNGGANSSAPLPHNVGSDIVNQVNGGEGPSHLSNVVERDVEMEDELSADIARSDALADYDIEVNIEGEAITEYLALVESAAGSSGKTSTSQ